MPTVRFKPMISACERPQTYALDRAATGTGRHHLVWWLNTKPCIIQSGIYMADYIPSTQNTIWSLFWTLSSSGSANTGFWKLDPVIWTHPFSESATIIMHTIIYSWPMFRVQETVRNIHIYVTASSFLWDLWILYSNDHRQHHHSPVIVRLQSHGICVCMQFAYNLD